MLRKVASQPRGRFLVLALLELVTMLMVEAAFIWILSSGPVGPWFTAVFAVTVVAILGRAARLLWVSHEYVAGKR